MRYIIDVTQLVHWPGHLTGIPRVMDELAIRFSSDPTIETIFVSWVKESGQLCEVDFIATRRSARQQIVYRRRLAGNSSSSMAETILNHRLTYLGKKAAKKIAAKSRLDRTSIYRGAVNSKQSLETKGYIPYRPISGDKLFIPWGEWWDRQWLDLVTLHHKKGVSIYPISHDILPMVVPQFSGNSSSLASFVRQVFPISRRVLTVSESSKRDLMHWMKQQKLDIPPIEVFRLGEDFSFKESTLDASVMEQKYNVIKGNYLIFVSTIEPRKNHQLLYYTYKLAKSHGITLPKLIIVGRIGHDVNHLVKMINNDPDTTESISIQNNVNDSELDWLYTHSLFAVMPSFYEGWGMSVLESIARSKPVVCSATSSLLEMPHDCVLYFNPSSTDECLSAITTMMKPATLKKYTNNTKKYTPHSWDQSYQQVLAILDK